MNKIIPVMFVFLSLTVNLFTQSLSAADEKNSVTEADALRKEYVAFLETQGYRGRVDRDGDVGFMCEGQYYFIQIEPDAPKFFRLVLASDWKIDGEKDRMRIIQAAEYATRVTKGAKVFLVNNRVWVTVEQFLPDKGGYRKIFSLSMEALKNGMLAFLEKMNELKK
ncbi:MAG TPA: hypothetical protein PKK43_05830 [Spirochaetota bacterium]|nr:hypothetical protein [Spirochaetota bacterium]